MFCTNCMASKYFFLQSTMCTLRVISPAVYTNFISRITKPKSFIDFHFHYIVRPLAEAIYWMMKWLLPIDFANILSRIAYIDIEWNEQKTWNEHYIHIDIINKSLVCITFHQAEIENFYLTFSCFSHSYDEIHWNLHQKTFNIWIDWITLSALIAW